MDCDQRFTFLVVIFASVSVISGELSRQNVSVGAIELNVFDESSLDESANWKSQYLDESLKSDTNCSGLKILDGKHQPKYSPKSSHIRKCCPHGQSYEVIDTGKEKIRQCSDDSFNFTVPILNATFYENCIEDNESGPKLSYTFTNACSFDANNVDLIMYAKPYGDLLYVIQNGSLLIVEENFEGYEIHTDYCLDVDRKDQFTYAIVCTHRSSFQARVLRAEAYMYAVCLWLSVPCLCLTSFLYLNVKDLRDLHGKSLACHCTCLAVAYTFLGIVQIQLNVSFSITYFIQYFLLSCICWLTALCFDICTKVMYIYIRKISCSVNTEDEFFTAYAVASFGLPVVPVILAWSKSLLGIPLYLIKGQHFTKLTHTGDYFILPAAFLLICCFCCLMITFYAFGTKKPKLPDDDWTQQAIIEYEEFFKLKQTAKSVGFLFGVMSICMLIEMTTSHLNTAKASNNPDMSPFAFFDVLIALQGVFIFIIFVCSPSPLRTIKRWWIDAGSFSTTELEVLK